MLRDVIFALFLFFVVGAVYFSVKDSKSHEEILNIIIQDSPVLEMSEYNRLSDTEQLVFLNNKGTIKK